jgi:hypothetical protein
LTLFNNYYGGYCFMPLHIYEGFSGKLITTILKPGRRSKSLDVFSILTELTLRFSGFARGSSDFIVLCSNSCINL